jgi:3-keto-disaccharide hydrolase
MRIIWLSTAFLLNLVCVPPASTMAHAGDGFETIFDGRSLAGWRGKSQFWSVRDGAITGETTMENPTKGNTFLIFTSDVADFELRLKVKILSGNSGIQFRSVDVGDFVVHGYQTDIDSTEKYLGDLYEEGGRGLLARGGEKVEISEDGNKIVVGKTHDLHEIGTAIRWQDWNDYHVIAKGNRVVQEINGLQTVDVIDKERKKARLEGILALQLHAGSPMLVQFKDIQLKPLK